MPMVKAHKVLTGIERIRTPVTHGEGIRHPHMSDAVSLFTLTTHVCGKWNK